MSYTRNSKASNVTVTLDERKDMGAGNLKLYPPAQPKRMPRTFAFPPPYPRGGGQGFGDWFNGVDDGVKLGLQVQDTDNDEGAQVISIAADSPAEKAGFKKEDIVTELAGSPVKSAADLSRAYRENRGKGNITVTIKRNNKTQTLDIKVPKKLNKADL